MISFREYSNPADSTHLENAVLETAQKENTDCYTDYMDESGLTPETPLIPPNDNNIPLQLQHSNTTNNNNNNINNNNLLQNNNRKSISNLSVRRRSSISHQDGGTTITQSTTYVSPDNKFYEETVETFHIVDEESSSSKSSSSTNINNNKMAPKVDAVSKITGQWGKWQLRTVLLIFLCKIPSSWFMACIIFTAPAPRHGEFYCKPPETIESTNHTQWIKISHPEKEEADDHEFNIDFCNVYQDARAHAHEYFHYDSETMEPKPWEKPEKNGAVIPCNSFEHKADYHSLITQFDLVCSRDILVAVTQFFHLFGVLTGGMLATHLLKHFSPKSIMLFGMLTQIFCGNMTGHVVSYELHVFFRCLSAVCCAQMYTAGAMIFTDITGGKYRTTCVCLFEQFWSIGVILLPAVSSFFKSWTHIYMAISFPTIILVYLWKWIPDSPRWLLQRGRLHEAREILIQCIEINGTQDSLPLDIDHQLKQQSIDLINAPPPAGWWTIWKGERAVLHMICVHLAWSIYIVIYYGMLLNIRAFSREHLEVNTVIAGCSEIIGTFIGLYLILNTSIKWQATGIFNIIAGCIAYLAWIIPPEIKGNNRVALLMLSAMISKIAISCTLSILTTCTVELVSDEKKKICAYSTIVWARIWLLTAPFVGATIIFGQLIPQTCFASLAIVGGILTTCINSPRTIPQSSPQTKVPNTKLNSNLPPELMPGIWTIKHHDEKYRI
ncbi:solute carrier family 22 member 3 isoform X2 [Condylostylus longicornis]|uniref:solute carrier family 22 member 3 isoform X2 n=1 Tax=Condylostylus longicornis TaxID=2530218 RepID=UPI00244E0B62|nr:solute carrier family 22 member 3 isoform X2 [Condylostylus longicornis]